MAILKATSESLDLTDDYTFTGKLSGHNYPMFLAKKTDAGQSVANASTTKITFNTTDFDTDSGFSTTNNRYVIPTGKNGKYFFYLKIQADAGNGANLYLRLYKNGTEVANIRNGTSGAQRKSLFLSIVEDAVADDYFEMFYYHDSGSAKTVDQGGTENVTYFGGYRIGS